MIQRPLSSGVVQKSELTQTITASPGSRPGRGVYRSELSGRVCVCLLIQEITGQGQTGIVGQSADHQNQETRADCSFCHAEAKTLELLLLTLFAFLYSLVSL